MVCFTMWSTKGIGERKHVELCGAYGKKNLLDCRLAKNLHFIVSSNGFETGYITAEPAALTSQLAASHLFTIFFKYVIMVLISFYQIY